jgi:hypothetical protein
MSDQEITDRDETRRLAYVLLAASYEDVRDARMHELIGTLAHALTHHSGVERSATGGVTTLNYLRIIFRDGEVSPLQSDEARRWLYGRIDRLGRDIDALKNPSDVFGAAGGEISENSRRIFLAVVHDALTRVASDPGRHWWAGEASGDTMHAVEVALDSYLRARDAS